MNAQEMYEQAMHELAAKISLIRSGDLVCDHPIKQGDNYGTSCSICGERLAGYGYTFPCPAFTNGGPPATVCTKFAPSVNPSARRIHKLKLLGKSPILAAFVGRFSQ